MGAQVRKTPFLRHCILKTTNLPRQARDSHRKNSEKEARFCSEHANGTLGDKIWWLSQGNATKHWVTLGCTPCGVPACTPAALRSVPESALDAIPVRKKRLC
jgi:hypothetical protein